MPESSPKKKVPSLTKHTVQLEGLLGTFFVDGCRIAVRYFSTYASPSPDAAGGHHDLLKQLVPMRERVKAAQLKNLDSLLQRDLSDERIAQDLIPYLQGKFSKVGFFPPVLAVLLPKGFIEGEGKDAPVYPKPKSTGGNSVDYGGSWTVTTYGEDNASRLGSIQINPNKTNIIVLDGQHRSNAFRYVAGVFEPEEAYSPFYQAAGRSEGYSSDLPVTLIWFESDSETVRPTDVSRELFVAVNNSAKRVSEARTVLLDDVSVVALGVNTYYRHLASSRGFAAEGQSLLTACFDLDSGLGASRYPGMALTTPVTLKSAFEYAFFGNARYDDLLDRATKHDQQNADRFKRIFVSPKYVQQAAITRVHEEQRDSFRTAFLTEYVPNLELLFEVGELTRSHYQACADLVGWIDANPAALLRSWWDKAFVGGEGLYSAFQLSDLKSCAPVKKVLTQINDKFFELRRVRALGKRHSVGDGARLDQCFVSFNSIAYQTGFLMAVEFLARKFFKSNWRKARRELENAIRGLSIEQWMTFFNEFRVAYIASTDPASWPRYEKMLVRVLGDYDEAFSETGGARFPEYVMIEDAIRTYVAETLDSTGAVDIKDVQRVADKKCQETAKVLAVFGVKPPRELQKNAAAFVKTHVAEVTAT
jgi:hypothetical protein